MHRLTSGAGLSSSALIVATVLPEAEAQQSEHKEIRTQRRDTQEKQELRTARAPRESTGGIRLRDQETRIVDVLGEETRSAEQSEQNKHRVDESDWRVGLHLFFSDSNSRID